MLSHRLSVGAVAGIIDQYVYDRHSRIFPCVAAKPGTDSGTVFTQCPETVTACRPDGFSGCGRACFVWTNICHCPAGSFNRVYDAPRDRGVHDPLPDIKAHEPLALVPVGKLCGRAACLQRLFGRPVRDGANDYEMRDAVCCICRSDRAGLTVSYTADGDDRRVGLKTTPAQAYRPELNKRSFSGTPPQTFVCGGVSLRTAVIRIDE